MGAKTMWRRGVLGVLAALLTLTGTPGGATAQDKAVTERFGGTEEDFTAKYGDPVATLDIPNRADTERLSYAIQGFETVEAMVHDGTIVGLTLRPVAGDTWSIDAVDTVIDDFGPTDAEFDGEQLALGGDVGGGTRVGIQGFSDGVAASLDEAVYEEFEAAGDPGDFFVALSDLGGGRYSGLMVTLGEASVADESGGEPVAAGAGAGLVTVSGFGTTVTDKFSLAAGRYRVTATVEIATAYGFDGFAVFFYPAKGTEELLFNELIDVPGTWTGSAVLDNPRSGEVFVAAENTESAWTLVFEPF